MDITKITEKKHGEWTVTKWSDGRVTMHRPITKLVLNPRGENLATAR